jgi:NADPH:quinone reductase-like Zn-dependent oxidoreductase
MKAIVQDRYGSPDVLQLCEVDKPALEPDRVLVRVRATSLQPVDWHTMRGEPRIMRLMMGPRGPKQKIQGVDVAGVVEEVGGAVDDLHPGDEVFGAGNGALAEYVAAKNVLSKPAGLTFEQAGSIAVAGCTALQGLRDSGRLQSGQTVLINGASGGVGTFAVQIAKALGAHVTGVCSTSNLELVRSLGADEVVDYTNEDFARLGRKYDLVLDVVGNRSFSDLTRATTRKGTLVVIGGQGSLFRRLFDVLVVGRFISQRALFFSAKINKEDLGFLKELVEAGKLTPVVDRTYPLSEAAEAMRYSEAGHARGKVVVTV